MARSKKARSRTGKARTGFQKAAANATRAAKHAEGLPAGSEEKPPRGVKLKTVSLFTLLFALACLGAFVAGRPPASAADVATARALPKAAGSAALRQDNARSLLRSSRRERKASPQKLQKRAGTRTPVSFLPADAQQKNEQPEYVGVLQNRR
jgi:hypothetical protein